MRRWGCRYGSLWMVQWVLDGWFSLGIHLDLKHRVANGGLTYGPYLDLHLGFVILSLGWHPYLSGDLERALSVSRGGCPQDAEGNLYGVLLTVLVWGGAADLLGAF